MWNTGEYGMNRIKSISVGMNFHTVGQKATDRFGNKFTVCRIIKNKDEHRFELYIMNSTGTEELHAIVPTHAVYYVEFFTSES